MLQGSTFSTNFWKLQITSILNHSYIVHVLRNDIHSKLEVGLWLHVFSHALVMICESIIFIRVLFPRVQAKVTIKGKYINVLVVQESKDIIPTLSRQAAQWTQWITLSHTNVWAADISENLTSSCGALCTSHADSL